MIKIDLLKELYNSFNDKRNKIINYLSDKENELEELQSSLGSMENNSDDIRIFTPYSTDEIYDNKFLEFKNKKNELVEDISNNYDLLKELNYYADSLNEVIVSCETFSTISSTEDEIESISSDDNLNDIISEDNNELIVNKNDDLLNDLIDLEHIRNELKNIKSFIKVDPNRAVMEVEGLIEEL